MILIVGAHGAGKTRYAQERFGLADDDVAVAALDDRPVLAGLHDLLRGPTLDADAVVAACLAKTAVISDEIGCGIVPLDRAEREWRDRTGRVCARLAAEADQVVRVVCGLPQIIKDSR